MNWKIEFEEAAFKELKKLGKVASSKIIKYLNTKIANSENPRRFGKALSSDKVGLWRYRVENYRIICRIEDKKLSVLIIRVGHRKDIYRNS